MVWLLSIYALIMLFSRVLRKSKIQEPDKFFSQGLTLLLSLEKQPLYLLLYFLLCNLQL